MYILHIYITYKIHVCILHKKLRELREKKISHGLASLADTSQHVYKKFRT